MTTLDKLAESTYATEAQRAELQHLLRAHRAAIVWLEEAMTREPHGALGELYRLLTEGGE